MSELRRVSAGFLSIFVGFLVLSAWPIDAACAQVGGVAPGAARDGADESASLARAALRLGALAGAQERGWPAAGVVVVARTPDEFLRAVEGWNEGRRYPVLIDDGTASAAWNIARFVKAYEPGRVLVVGGDADGAAWGDAVGFDRLAGVVEGARRGARVPGVVVVDGADPAWAGGVLLAAGRNQELMGVSSPNTVRGRIDAEVLAGLRGSIESVLTERGVEWSGLGDGVDAVTLCVNMPAVLGAGQAARAVTDLVGRDDAGRRWAWAGQVHGNIAESAYRANCALFLGPARAWVFDGYEAGFGGGGYAVGGVRERLAGMGVGVSRLVGPPHSTRLRWSVVTRGGLDADLVMVNTSGSADWFKLLDARVGAGDVPVLARPTAVHFIHSFSAQRVWDERTIAGAWLDRGAFAYVGSVHEPFLSAFVPHEMLALRLGAGMPWGAASRKLSGRFADAWKIAVFGDPLYGLGVPPRVVGEGVEVAGAREIGVLVAEAAAAGDVGEAVRLLVMAGRDGEALELARALVASREGVLDDGFVRVVMPLAALASDAALMADVHAWSGGGVRGEVGVAALLWQVLRHELAADEGRYVSVLMGLPRRGSLLEDAGELRPHVARVFGSDAVLKMYERFAGAAPSDRVRDRVLRAAPGR